MRQTAAVVLLIHVVLLSACVTTAWVQERYSQKLTAFVSENGRQPSEVEKADLYAEAQAEVEKEAADQRALALKSGAEAAGKFAAGDLIGGGLAALQLLFLGVGAVKKRKGA